MNDTRSDNRRADPDSLIALIPVLWDDSEVGILAEVHPDIWAEPLIPTDPPPAAAASFLIGDSEDGAVLHIDEPIPELAEMIHTAKQPFTPAETLQLEKHTVIWRVTLSGVSQAPLERAHDFARLVATAIEAGAPGVFFPFCLQLHSPRLVKHLAVDFRQPPALINFFVNAWNDDEWMVTRGLTVFGLPELETPIEGGLNDAYFRLMDVAAGMLLQRDAYPSGSQLQLGPHLFAIETGPAGPDDSKIPISGVYGRLTIARPD